MKFSGKYLIFAKRDEVWRALNDTEILKDTIPKCNKINWVADDRLELALSVNLGIIKPKFEGYLELKNVNPAINYTLIGHGKGGLLGHAYARSDIELSDYEGGTCLYFIAEGGGSGKLMKLGEKFIGNSAQKIIDRFFERFAKAMGVKIKAL